jgi:hypothetical protein
MFEFIKRWKERRRRKAILEDIKKAKQYYTEEHEIFMCICFQRVNFYKYRNYESIHKLIPEFNREYLGSYMDERYHVWWFISDRESRIKAFDKLIKIYS